MQDVEVYKSTIRDDIEMWMRVLTQYNLMDWMIVVVETYDFRKSNKLIPRSTVYDKIRSDYGAKHADRYFFLSYQNYMSLLKIYLLIKDVNALKVIVLKNTSCFIRRVNFSSESILKLTSDFNLNIKRFF